MQHAGRNLLGTKPKPDVKAKRPFTVPPYYPAVEQLDNMKRLSGLILDGAEESFKVDWSEVADLYRDQGLFVQAQGALSRCTEGHQRVIRGVTQRQVADCSVGPIRFRM